MVIRFGVLKECIVAASDGELGRVRDVYFDDEHWVIRHFIVSTSRWLGRDVLISPRAVASVDTGQNRVTLNVTTKKVQESPSLDVDRPVSKREAEVYYRHYGWPVYWANNEGFVGVAASLAALPGPMDEPSVVRSPLPAGDPHLRSAREVVGYHIRCRDGDVGHLEDLLVDQADWTIPVLVVDPHNWWPGKHVVIVPQLVRGIDWSRNRIHVDLSHDQIETAPVFDPNQPITAIDEGKLRSHFGLNPS
jgi:sporulation protein YlmC with PRC-barrel domain